MPTYVDIAEITADDMYEELERLKDDLPDRVHAISVEDDDAALLTEVHDEDDFDGEWRKVAEFTASDAGEAAYQLGQDWNPSECRVVSDYTVGEDRIERKQG